MNAWHRALAHLPSPRSPISIRIQVRRAPVTREEWLGHAVEALRPLLGDAGAAFPRRVRVSVGFGGNTGRYERTVGAVCFARESSRDGRPQIFISPVFDEEYDVLRGLLHELVHASDDCVSGHRGHFARTHRAVGFVGSATGAEPGFSLGATLERIADDLRRAHGRYPHAALGWS